MSQIKQVGQKVVGGVVKTAKAIFLAGEYYGQNKEAIDAIRKAASPHRPPQK